MKKTSIQIFTLFCIELIILFPIYTVNALTITNVAVSDITSSSAIVGWNTDQEATGIVNYGSTPDLGSAQSHSNNLLEHSFFLTGLNSETTHYFSVESTDTDGDSAIDNNSGQFHTFTTLDVTPPEKVEMLSVEDVTTNSLSIVWNDVAASDLSHYNIYRDGIKIANTSQSSFQDTGLSPSTIYSYKVSAVDLSGNEGPLSDIISIQTLLPDITAPVITSLQLLEVTSTTATFNWLTDENSTSVVYYGSEGILDMSEEISSFTKNHTLILQQLITSIEYSFIASSCDRDNNCANSTRQSFTAGRDITPPIINITIPEFVNAPVIDIIGTTEPFSDVKLFVNDLNVPVRFLDSSKVSDGVFEFFNIALQIENVIRITAKDIAGNENERLFSVTVDTQDPEVVLDDIPSVTTKKNISIIGVVNEPVIINIILDQDADFTIPNQVTGLNATLQANSVILDWDQVDIGIFSHYVIYRNDIPIATTNPESYNTFTDLLVNSDFTYTYEVSLVTIFGKESPKSDSITVTIPAGGNSGIAEPAAIDIIQQIKEPELSLNTSGAFSASINLNNDAVYSLKIEVIDRAKNKVVIEKEIILDTIPPKIEIISPPRGTDLYENYADEVDIVGITEPNAEVHLFIQRTPLGFLNKSFDVSGLPDQIQDLPESELRADCRFAIGSKEFCNTGADMSTISDNEGNFFFDDVDLTSLFSVGISITQVPVSEFSQDLDLRESKKSTLVFIATDKSGNRGSIKTEFGIITCWSGNQSWDIIPLTEFQSPTLISTERLAEGNEHIFFYFNYSYQGRGESGTISDISLSKACAGTELLEGSRFNISCKILPAGVSSTRVNPQGTISYTALRLESLENMDKWLKDDWENFFDQLGTEITFPFRIRIKYDHVVDGVEVSETQTICQEVSYLIDNSRIDPREVLPDWLLFDFVEFLDESVLNLNKAKKQIDTVLEFVVIGCVGSFLLRLVVQVHRRFVTFLEEKKDILKQFSSLGGPEDYCTKVSENIAGGGKIKLSQYSDKDLKKCFPDVAAAWDLEANLYKAYRFTCDRVFGHETPSKWTENLEDKQITTRLQTGQLCAVDNLE